MEQMCADPETVNGLNLYAYYRDNPNTLCDGLTEGKMKKLINICGGIIVVDNR